MIPLYQLLPITVPPVADGWYDFSDQTGELKAISMYFCKGVWYENEEDSKIEYVSDDAPDLSSDYTGYLSPIPEEQVRKMIGEIWNAGWRNGYDPKLFPDRETFINEYLKQM